ncbi:hypothetical protein Lesp02_36050 [Lentzea sp. NBRC 105346]|uniref:AMED_5909 family protein n=1 Tax=Lentzea sp. NBRC 105346 TaxID=3032205 RepID=UPI0024A39051|nr:AMED_5909 family protein [Lentzea sp. NBRC 105346]GLZ31417.1 hypothetical protein Lesp02_36050 [Lentzea sp. NBRC 105346]
MAANRADRWAVAMQARTLREVHGELTSLLPAPDADLKEQHDYYTASARAYARVAEIDRDHHHEATYWANREREKAEEIGQRMKGKATQSR